MPLSLRHVCRSCRGFSATEVTTILTPLTVLSGMAAPAVSDYVEDAKLIRADSRSRTGWRGAYLQDPVSSDPWGHRCEVNVSALRSQHFDTVVLSAGRDGIVESPFERDGLPSTGDDLVAVVSSSGMCR